MGRVNFGRINNDTVRVVEKRQQVSIEDMASIKVDNIQLVEVPVEVIKEIEVIREVPVEKVVTIEVIKQVIKEIEVPVVVTKIEVVEIEKPIDRIVEKIVTVIDTTGIFEEKQKNRKLETKLKRSYLALACMIVVSMIMAVI